MKKKFKSLSDFESLKGDVHPEKNFKEFNFIGETKIDKDLEKIVKYLNIEKDKLKLDGNISIWGLAIYFDSPNYGELEIIRYEKEWRHKDSGSFMDYVFVAFPNDKKLEDYFKSRKIPELVDYTIKNMNNFKK